MTTTKILVVDNYDSFVYTLSGYLQELGAQTDVVRNDAFAVEDLRYLDRSARVAHAEVSR